MSVSSRRTVVKGAAWAAPAVVATSMVPSYAASQNPTVSGTACSLFYGTGSSVNYQTHNLYLGVKSSTGILPAGSTVSWTFTMTSGSEVPSTNYSQNGRWSLELSPAPGTAATSFTVTLRANTDITDSEVNCSAGLIWTSNYSVRPGTTITMSSQASGDVISAPAGLSYTVAKRYPASVNDRTRTAHIYLSKSGEQTCYPDIRYTLTGASQGSTCAARGGNDTATVFPGGSCDMYVARPAEVGGQTDIKGQC